ncbi:ABC transporter ATP-binding protein [Micrococcus terreus]|uniref:ABC transporter ATP-binding protein n=1 Tax=Micrococcus terreus TaxID=574650 RepID=UPI00254AB443|nr:ABC transporter ATP-binding protein [Micrococcus terreus]MDK7700780.1 ABC transporter ATP-binding protein [Micrococcus terreus]WOO96940.1 ABC transporter ATP-binding protein [Micrococcus terreus]
MRSLARILSFTRELTPLYVGIVAAAVITSLLTLAVPFITGAATDQIVAGLNGSQTVETTIHAVLWLAGAFLAVELISTLVSAVGGYWGDVMAARMRTILSTRYFAQLLALPQRYFDNELTGKITSRLNRSITELTQFLNFFANNAFTMLITTAAVLVISAIYWWPLAALLATIFPIYMWLTAKTSGRWQALEKEKNHEVDVAAGRFAEVVAQMPVVKSFVQEPHEHAGFSRHYHRIIGVTRTQSRYWHGMDAWRRAALNLVFFGLYALIFIRTATGEFSVGDMVMLIQLMAMARQPVTSMSYLVDASQRAIAGSTDYFEVMDQRHDRQPDPRILAAIGPVEQTAVRQRSSQPSTTTAAPPDASDSPEGSPHPAPASGEENASVRAVVGKPSSPRAELEVSDLRALRASAVAGQDGPGSQEAVPAVAFRDVTFGYEDGPDVLRGISFHVGQGEKVALVGESGGGKSTLASLLMGLYPVHSGAVEVFGADVDELPVPVLRAGVAAVFQDPSLFSGTIRENIAYARPDATDEQVRAAARVANADRFVERLAQGYDSLIGERGLKLSGGQKQRIAVARAVLKDAPVLILDEATSSLDTRSERLVQAALDQLMVGRASLIVAHRLSTIAAVDRIVTLRDGQVDEIGAPAELAVSGGIYAELLALQNQGTEAAKKALQQYGIAG